MPNLKHLLEELDENVKETELHAFMRWKRSRTILSRHVQHTESEMSGRVVKHHPILDTGKRSCLTCLG
jgi:hypothetical protein